MRALLTASGALLFIMVAAAGTNVSCAGGEQVDNSTGSGAVAGPGSGGAGAEGGRGGEGGSGGACDPGTQELCNGEDDTCDGVVDEGCDCVEGDTEPCFTDDPSFIGTGVCKEGKRTCDIHGQLGACEGQVLPSPEQCNGLDDDCDGTTDEDLGTITCGEGICQVTVDKCKNGMLVDCEPGPPDPDGEKCNGTDDDCDGKVDEGCSCLDGQVQSCYSGNPGTVNVGTCKEGTQTCTGGQWGPCMGDVTPVAEKCNGLDDDCDGAEDDNDPEGGSACNTGNQGICAAGVQHCAGGQLVCQQTNQPGSETCNGLDDDCDGMVDDGNPGGGASCLTGNPGVCAAGTMTCQGGSLVCVQNVQPSAETCNGLDDDCDGMTDENNPGGGGACSTGLPGPCAAGTLSCLGGTVQCVQNVQPGVETCNGIDDDCNGAIDNGNNPCGGACALSGTPNTPCDGLDGDQCNEGVWQCSGLNTVVCSDSTSTNVESCNGQDDDCDGIVDEGSNPCGGVCSLAHQPNTGCDGGDTDLCNEGVWQCSGLNAVVCSDQTANNVEVCDAIDQDCDGNISEGPCSLPNASSTCNNGSCVITTCNSGFANCDSNNANGCEVQNSGWSNSPPGEFLGTFNADAQTGFPFCSGEGCDPLLTKTGTRGRYFTINAHEDSSCCAYVSLKFELIVPAGVDYDLYVTGSACQADPAFSQTGNGNKTIVVWCNDDCGGDDNSFTANVEVRYASGSSCQPWTLNVYRNQC